MNASNYTEKDLQNYAGGRFEGDVKLFEEFLNGDKNAKAQVNLYKVLYQGLRKEVIPGISFNVADKVLAILEAEQKKKEKKEMLWARFHTYGLGAVFVAALIITGVFWLPGNSFELVKNGIFWLSALILMIFVGGFHYVEFNRRTSVPGRY